MSYITSQTELKWTAKIPLSSRIIDPLGIYLLRRLESEFLPGITTQTSRLRYFSYLPWIWKTVEGKKLDSNKILDIEKIITLIASTHHMTDSSPPTGIRNRESAKKFLLESNNSVKVDDYTSFGRNNRIGYGNYFYRGPLETLKICGRNKAGEYIFSEIGEKIVDIVSKVMKNREFILTSNQLTKEDLTDLQDLCLCVNNISYEEQEIWRLVFFGFTTSPTGFVLGINEKEFNKFRQGNLQFPEIQLDSKFTMEQYLKDANIVESGESNNLNERMKRKLARRFTLFVILKIIKDVKPSTNGEPINQIIRDCLYFHQFSNGQTVNDITFGKLEHFVNLWESYVHNLYYINFLELLFDFLLNTLKHNPMGTTISEICKSFDISKIENYLSIILGEKLQQTIEMKDIDHYLKRSLDGKKTTLKTKLNEKKIAISALKCEIAEEKIANLLILFLLLRYRFENFSQNQSQISNFQDYNLFSVNPKQVYSRLGNGNIWDFINQTLNLIKNRHRLIASKKFALNGTKAWLFSEEDENLYHYGRDYWITFYREAKWLNVLSLLEDMGLTKTKQDIYCLSELGEKWLKRIF